MKISDLEYLESIPQIANSKELKVTGGIQIEALSTVISLGEKFALSKTFSFTWSYAPGLVNVLERLG